MNIRNVGLAVIAASVAGYAVLGKRGQGVDVRGRRRCCTNPATCLCALNAVIFEDIARAVRDMPECIDPASN